ncbi:MAG: hypothetical protein ACKOWK_04435 [Micrococcales bacterium]
MSNAVEPRTGRQHRVLLLALSGIFALWICALAAAYFGVVQEVNDPSQNQVSAATYLWLLGIVAMGLTAVVAKRRARALPAGRLTHSVASFSQVLVIVTLVVGTLYGFVVFVGNAFNRAMSGTGTTQSELARVLNVYLPIILAAGLLVAVIILAFVHTATNDEEEAKND